MFNLLRISPMQKENPSRGVLITRATEQQFLPGVATGSECSDVFAACGLHNLIELPVLDVVPPSDNWQELDEYIRVNYLARFDTDFSSDAHITERSEAWIIFSSVNGVAAFVSRCVSVGLMQLKCDSTVLETKVHFCRPKTACVGRATAEYIETQIKPKYEYSDGICMTVDFIPPEFTMVSLIEHFPTVLKGNTPAFNQEQVDEDASALPISLKILIPRVENGGQVKGDIGRSLQNSLVKSTFLVNRFLKIIDYLKISIKIIDFK